MNAGHALQQAMRNALLIHAPLTTLLGGAHIFDEIPRGEKAPFIAFTDIETRDWSVMDQKAHEHFVSIEVQTNERGRALAQSIVQEIEIALDNTALTLATHRLINLRVVFWNVSRRRGTSTFGAIIRFRAATEPL